MSLKQGFSGCLQGGRHRSGAVDHALGARAAVDQAQILILSGGWGCPKLEALLGGPSNQDHKKLWSISGPLIVGNSRISNGLLNGPLLLEAPEYGPLWFAVGGL